MTPAEASPSALDPAMPLLSAALDVASVTPLLHQATDAEVISARLVRHKPARRCMIEYVVRTPAGQRVWLGKMRAKGLDNRAFAFQQAAYDAGLAVARPIAAIPELAMWLQEKLSGRSFLEVLEAFSPADIGSRVAEAIGSLHRSPLRPPREHTADDELASLEARLTKMLPPGVASQERIQRLLSRCGELLQAAPPGPAVCLHRDFYHDQILFGDNRSFLLDLDLAAIGDAALDVGNFLAHLQELSVRCPQLAARLQGVGDSLVSHCTSQNPIVSLRAIRLYEAVSLARHVQISVQFPERAPFSRAIMDRVETLISSLN
jgi:streptomycin 6-kinase